MVVGTQPNGPRIIRQILRPLLVFFIVSFFVAYLNEIDHPFKAFAIPDLTISLLGAALGILLAFRTNSAYDRWWEARKLWGSLVNNSRSIARQAVSFTDATANNSEEARVASRALVYHHIAFVHGLRCHLRKQEPWNDIAPFLDSDVLASLRQEQNVPAAILQRMGEISAQFWTRGLLTELQLHRLDSTFSELANVQGACERIKNTPLPRQYDFYPELIVKVYCTVLPFVLVDELKVFTPVATLMVSFAFLVLNRIGKNLEDPFENSVYDTPMTALSRTIEINLRQTLGERELPSPVQPVDGVLW
jgi:ion channel-forming bestrophin family protein